MVDKKTNLFEQLEKYTGISVERQKQIFENVRNNRKKLESCSHHDFLIEIPVPHSKIQKKYQCTHCKGIVDIQEKYWYELGLLHARNEVK